MQKENKKKEKNWVWLFVLSIVVNLFLYIMLNSYLLIFVLVIFLWFLFFYFFFRRIGIVSLKVIIGLVIMLVISWSLFAVFSQSDDVIDKNSANKQTQEVGLKEKKTKDPYLEMKVVKHPAKVDCYKGGSVIEVVAKNTGGKDLRFEDVKNGRYEFSLCDGDKEGFSCFPMPDYIKVNDFGNIAVGEERKITINSASATGANSLTEFKKTKQNGKYKYFILFSKIENPKKKPPISQSDIFTVNTNIMNETNEYIKDCEK